MATSDVFASQWRTQLREKARQHWKALTDDDLEKIDGQIDVLIELLQVKYGYTLPLAEDAVKRFVKEASAEPVH